MWKQQSKSGNKWLVSITGASSLFKLWHTHHGSGTASASGATSAELFSKRNDFGHIWARGLSSAISNSVLEVVVPAEACNVTARGAAESRPLGDHTGDTVLLAVIVSYFASSTNPPFKSYEM